MAMRDAFEFDLSSLEEIFERPLDFRLKSLDCCVPEITISPEILATIYARYPRLVSRIIGPSEFCPTLLTGK